MTEDSNYPSGFVKASTLREVEQDEDESDVTVFIDNGVRYCTGGERTQEYLYMENMPDSLENKC